MRTYLAALTLLMALTSNVWAYWDVDLCAMDTDGQAIDPNGQVQGTAGDPSYFVCTKDNKCKAYVVLVSFADKTWGWYEDDDQPSGYSWDLFNQFFNGGYRVSGEDIPAYKGTTAEPRQATGKVAETEAVFGSLRAYFDEVYGGDIIEFELLNKKNTDNSPMWLQLPRTKYEYANLSGSDLTFWNDAEAAVRADGGTALNSVPINFPYKTAPASTATTLLRNKAIYVYAGLTVTNYSPLHPRVDWPTSSATSTDSIGARMVIGERQGWDWGLDPGKSDRSPTEEELRDMDHTVDRFTAIGIHVHEWGHLFGFIHPDGEWDGTNPHYNNQMIEDGIRANILGWGAMQNGAHGPVIAGKKSDGRPSNARIPYGSCPNPYNPFYRRDLGWNNVETIQESDNDKKIRPGPAHIYVINSHNGYDYLLDFRDVSTSSTDAFGQYAAYKELSSSGLLIWRRPPGRLFKNNPMLIPSDGRSLFDARQRITSGPHKGEPASDPSDIMFNDLLSDPFAAAAQTHGPTVTEATSILKDHFTTGTRANRSPTLPSFLAFRDIKIGSDSEGAYAEVDVHFIPLPPTRVSVAENPTDADANAVVLTWNAPDMNGTDAILGYQYSTDGGTTWLPSLDAEPLTLINSGAIITGLDAADLTFRVRTVSAGFSPDNVSPASDTTVLNRAGRVEVRAADDAHTPPSVGDQLTATLTDANVSNWTDDGVGVRSWAWQRSADGTRWTSASTSRPLTATNLNTYELAAADVGHQVQVVVEYDDGVWPEPDTATSAAVTVNSRPVITSTDAKATSPSVDENSTDAVYTYTASDPDDNAITWSLGGTNATLFTMNSDGELTFAAGAAPDFEGPNTLDSYMVTVTASDGSLSSDALSVTVTVNDVDEPPAFAEDSPRSVAMDENIARVGEYEADDPEGHPITWLALTGTDASAFELASGSNPDKPNQRTLQFKAAALPNFEEKIRYTVTLQVSSQPEGGGGAAQTASLPVTVAIRNAEDVGELVLSGLTSAPVVGTALVAQLTDEDGNIRVPAENGWQWQRKEPHEAETAWEAITAPAVGGTAEIPPEMNSYTPTDADRDHLLRVNVSYTDGYGSDPATPQAANAAPMLKEYTVGRRVI